MNGQKIKISEIQITAQNKPSRILAIRSKIQIQNGLKMLVHALMMV
jgi:hypothetical protein